MSLNGMKILLLGCFLAFFTACGSDAMNMEFNGNNPDDAKGLAVVSVKLDQLEKAAKINPRATTRPSDIVRVEVSAQPADMTDELEYVDDTNTFTGLMVVTVGSQVFTANAYDEDNTLVAQGTANADIVANQTASVSIDLFDISGDLPDPQYGPIILSMTVSNTNPRIGEEITVSVQAEDPDGDPLEYLWEHNCSDAAFGDATAASTTWSSEVQEACTLTITVTAGGLSDSDSTGVVVFPNSSESGAAEIEAEYFIHPTIYKFRIQDSDGTLCEYSNDFNSWLNEYTWVTNPSDYRSEFNGTCYTPLKPDYEYDFRTSVAGNFHDADPEYEILIDCGGEILNSYNYTTNCSWLYNTCIQNHQWEWRSPETVSLCTITAKVTAYGFDDELSFVVLVKEEEE